uniref:Uncharacterized protein n=1 Tax=Micrurus lemniscatus lemniscatus TaxID=129467 RepID=A0A2D4IUR9_MICLE
MKCPHENNEFQRAPRTPQFNSEIPKLKVSPVQSCPTLGHSAHLCPALSKDIFCGHVAWLHALNTATFLLKYLLTYSYLHAFKLLGRQELGQGMGAHSHAWHSADQLSS